MVEEPSPMEDKRRFFSYQLQDTQQRLQAQKVMLLFIQVLERLYVLIYRTLIRFKLRSGSASPAFASLILCQPARDNDRKGKEMHRFKISRQRFITDADPTELVQNTKCLFDNISSGEEICCASFGNARCQVVLFANGSAM